MSYTIRGSLQYKRPYQPLITWLGRVADHPQAFKEWNNWQKILFRFFFLFFMLLIIPIDPKFYNALFSISWTHLNFHQLFDLTKYQPRLFTNNQPGDFGAGSFADWGVIALISVAGTLVWTKTGGEQKEYTVLYYWLRVAIRFRLAAVLVTYGFIKLFPLQMPYPSLSNLLTNYGDFYAWKIYFQTLGISPKYESFLGFVEILAAILLFYRKTVSFGVGLVFGFIGNVAVVNEFYDVGEQVISTYIVLSASFLLAYDVPRLYQLLIKEHFTRANRFIPVFAAASLRKTRVLLKSAFVIFVLLFACKAAYNFLNDPYKIPHTPGLSKAYGFYNVKEFILNHDTIPYSKTDPGRWQNVIFEKWSTLTIKDNRPVQIDKTSGEAFHEKDIDRNYELAGHAGRHYYYYEADTLHHTLALQNKNISNRSEKLFFTYTRPNDSTILLSGINERRDSIHVVLNRIDKKYMMFEGRRKPVKI